MFNLFHLFLLIILFSNIARFFFININQHNQPKSIAQQKQKDNEEQPMAPLISLNKKDIDQNKPSDIAKPSQQGAEIQTDQPFHSDKSEKKSVEQNTSKYITFGYQIQNPAKTRCYWNALPTDILKDICLLVLTDGQGDYLPIDENTLQRKKKDYETLFWLNKHSQKTLVWAVHTKELFPDISKRTQLNSFNISFFNKHFPIFMLHYLPANIGKCLKTRRLPANTTYKTQHIEGRKNVLFIQAIEILKNILKNILKETFIDQGRELNSYSMQHIPINNFTPKDVNCRHESNNGECSGRMYTVCLESILRVLRTTSKQYPLYTQHILIQHLIELHKEYSTDIKYDSITEALKTGIFYISCINSTAGMQFLTRDKSTMSLNESIEQHIKHINKKYCFNINNVKTDGIDSYTRQKLISRAIKTHFPNNNTLFFPYNITLLDKYDEGLSSSSFRNYSSIILPEKNLTLDLLKNILRYLRRIKKVITPDQEFNIHDKESTYSSDYHNKDDVNRLKNYFTTEKRTYFYEVVLLPQLTIKETLKKLEISCTNQITKDYITSLDNKEVTKDDLDFLKNNIAFMDFLFIKKIKKYSYCQAMKKYTCLNPYIFSFFDCPIKNKELPLFFVELYQLLFENIEQIEYHLGNVIKNKRAIKESVSRHIEENEFNRDLKKINQDKVIKYLVQISQNSVEALKKDLKNILNKDDLKKNNIQISQLASLIKNILSIYNKHTHTLKKLYLAWFKYINNYMKINKKKSFYSIVSIIQFHYKDKLNQLYEDHKPVFPDAELTNAIENIKKNNYLINFKQYNDLIKKIESNLGEYYRLWAIKNSWDKHILVDDRNQLSWYNILNDIKISIKKELNNHFADDALNLYKQKIQTSKNASTLNDVYTKIFGPKREDCNN